MKDSHGDAVRTGEGRRKSRCGLDDTDAAERTGLMDASASDDSGAGNQLGALLDRVRVRIETASASSARLMDEEDSTSGPSSTAGSPRSPSSPVPNEGDPRVMASSPASSSPSSPALRMVATATEDLISRIQDDDVKEESSTVRSLSTAFRRAFGLSPGPGSRSASPAAHSSKRPSPEHHAIPMEEPRSSSPDGDAACGESSVAPGHGECSMRSVCGPNPARLAIAIAIILSIWASVILGIHVHKKVSTMEDRLLSMSQKMLDLQTKYVFMQEDSAKEIQRLHERLHRLQSPTPKRDVSFSEEPEEEVPVHERPAPELIPTKNIKISTSTDNNQTSKSAKASTCTSDGHECIFPFFYNGQNRTECLREWYQPRSWCAVKVDANGHLPKNDKTAWGYCAGECPRV